MDRGRPPSNKNSHHGQLRQTRRKTRIGGYLSGKRKPIKAAKVDPVKENKKRLAWWLKWVIFLPIFAYALTWIVIIFIDLFKY